MSSDDVCRQHAAEAERQAQLARNDLDRAAWLRVADGWRGLLRRRPQSDEEDFDAQSKAKGTGQDDSHPRIKAASVGGLFRIQPETRETTPYLWVHPSGETPPRVSATCRIVHRRGRQLS